MGLKKVGDVVVSVLLATAVRTCAAGTALALTGWLSCHQAIERRKGRVGSKQGKQGAGDHSG